MAEIDKALPNVNNAVEIERPELEVDLIDQGTESDVPFDVTQLEDGGVELDFEPGMKKIPGTENHFDNLADLLPDDILNPIGSEMQSLLRYRLVKILLSLNNVRHHLQVMQ